LNIPLKPDIRLFPAFGNTVPSELYPVLLLTLTKNKAYYCLLQTVSALQAGLYAIVSILKYHVTSGLINS